MAAGPRSTTRQVGRKNDRKNMGILSSDVKRSWMEAAVAPGRGNAGVQQQEVERLKVNPSSH